MSISSWRAILLTLCFGTFIINAVSDFSDGIEDRPHSDSKSRVPPIQPSFA